MLPHLQVFGFGAFIPPDLTWRHCEGFEPSLTRIGNKYDKPTCFVENVLLSPEGNALNNDASF